MNLLHLAGIPDVVKPRLAVEAAIVIVIFGILMAIVMEVVAIIANVIAVETVYRLWLWISRKLAPDHNPFRLDSANVVHLHRLRTKTHESKKAYYLNLLTKADDEENQHSAHIRKTGRYALTALLLGCINIFAPLAPGSAGVLAQIADGLGPNGYSWMFILGCFLLIVAFYPIFEDRHPTVYCPELARHLFNKERRER